MNRKSFKILIFTVLLAGIFCTAAWYWYGFFTPYNAFTAKKNIAEGKIQILYYGEMDPNQKLVDKVAEQFGFQYKRVDDCTVIEPLINGVKRYNEVVYDHLYKIKGKNWEEEFNARIDSILDLDR